MLRRLFPMLFLGSAAFAQLSQDQKVTDFMQLVGLYVKNYEPYSWKRDVIGFDLYNVKPWLDRVKQTTQLPLRHLSELNDTKGARRRTSPMRKRPPQKG